jgi:hypothetical protein
MNPPFNRFVLNFSGRHPMGAPHRRYFRRKLLRTLGYLPANNVKGMVLFRQFHTGTASSSAETVRRGRSGQNCKRKMSLTGCPRLLEAQQIAARWASYQPSGSTQRAPMKVLARCMARSATRLRQRLIFSRAEPAPGATLTRRRHMRPYCRRARPQRPPAVE